MRVEHFVEFLHPGTLFAEHSARRVETRDASSIELPANAYGFRFYSQRIYETRREDGKLGEDRETFNQSHWTYEGELLTVADVVRLERAEPGRWSILLSNMGGPTGSAMVCRTRLGNHVMLEALDRVRPPRGGR